MKTIKVRLSNENGSKLYSTTVKAEDKTQAFLLTVKQANEQGIEVPEHVWASYEELPVNNIMPIAHSEAIRLSMHSPQGKLYVKVNGRLHKLYSFIGPQDNTAIFEHNKNNFSIPVFDDTKFYKEN